MDKDKQFLLAALEQAVLGRGLCAPNPSVGAVAVLRGEIIAQAYHQGAGSAHAEALLLQQLPADACDISLYVTLEPCNHWGRTPPCVDAIIKHPAINQVIFGYYDPNPIVRASETSAILSQHGISCRFMKLSEITAFYQSYTHWLHTNKPFVTAKLAQSLDGKIAEADNKPCAISNACCNEFTHQQRKQADVILTTARTIICDDPMLNARVGTQCYAKDLAIIDSQLCLPMDAKLFTLAKKIHIFHDAAKKAKACTDGRIHYHPIVSTTKGLVLAELITALGALGYHDVWVEAGARLFSSLHQADLVDRTYIYIAPKILGDRAINAYTEPFLTQQTTARISWSIMADNAMLQLDWRTNTCLQD